VIRGLNFADYAPDAIDYSEKSYIFITIPTTFQGSSTSPGLPDGRSECILRGSVSKQNIFSTPGFPSPISQPFQTRYLVKVTTDMGLGMFASSDIKMGDLIIAERPLMVTPGAVDLNIDYLETISNDQKRQIVLLEWEKVLDRCFQRLSNEDQAAFLTLANTNNKDGSGQILGKIRTNGFAVTLGEGFFKDYSAVCKELSRVNHRYVCSLLDLNFDN
jgi:hypothetical protein